MFNEPNLHSRNLKLISMLFISYWLLGLTPADEKIRLLVINYEVSNPCALSALVAARELSLLLIVLGVGYLLFTGVAALPLSIAVLLGAGIIALAIYKAKAA